MSNASVAAARARSVPSEPTAERKIDKLSEAVDFLARAVADLEHEIGAMKRDMALLRR